MIRSAVLAAAVVLAAVPLTGCGTSQVPPTAVAVAKVADAGTPMLVSRSTVGGLCPGGVVCSTVITVSSDGTWAIDRNGSRASAGVLGGSQVNALQGAVRRTSLDTAPLFTGECPSASDGVETVFTWMTSSGVLRQVSSCSREIPASDPLVTATATVLDPLVR